MLFPTMTFAIFFLIVFSVAWSLDRENGRRKAFLVLASWVFYGWWDWRFIGLLIASATLNFLVAELIDRSASERGRKWLVALGVAINLTILGFFKYYGFFVEQLGDVLKVFGWQRDLPLLQVILPVGISFFTFQGISYVVDVYRGHCQKARSLLDIMLLMSFFPHLVAGPIVRASDLLPQFDQTPRLNRAMVSHALILIVWGLFKKTVIASELSVGLVDPVFFDPTAHSALDLLAATYGYAAQIYCDFSAYSDIAIGVAGLLGYRFPRNFDQPYRAASLQDFWRRWHISLSSWLRDYLYIPLGGGRGAEWKICRNLMITMLLGGLWHGAAWTFVAWGALHGGVLVFERLWKKFKPAAWPRLPTVLGVLITFHIVCLSWILFRAESFSLALDFLAGFGRWGPASVATPFFVSLIAIGLGMHFLPPRAGEAFAGMGKYLPSPALGAAAAALMLVIEAVRPEGIAPFIYFQF
jgi:D-alanyl-lipoteichoic acid acyltransferase DltB (MBOAT superfamily)